jgi:uncharacterized protein YjbJ (UPF0337 family)
MSDRPDDEHLEVTREGLLGELAGRAKAAAGAFLGNDKLTLEGRLQQAKIEAEAEAAASAGADAHDAAAGPAPTDSR